MNDYSITEAEWEIMKVLWRRSNVTLKDIIKNLDDNNWSYSTIKTLLRRLVAKGAVDVDKSISNSFKYNARIKEEDCKLKEANNFMQRVFDGSISMFVSTLVKESNLTDDERKELMKMIDKMEEQ